MRKTRQKENEGGEKVIEMLEKKRMTVLSSVVLVFLVAMSSVPVSAAAQYVRSIIVVEFDGKGNTKGVRSIDPINFLSFYECRGCPCSTYEIIRRIVDVVSIWAPGTTVNIPPWGVKIYFGRVYTRSSLAFWLPGPYVVPINTDPSPRA
jgi:hypothetical protein